MNDYSTAGTVNGDLYKGDLRGMAIGDLLKDMARKGRKVVDEQAIRWAENRAMYSGNPFVRATRAPNGQLRIVARDEVDYRGRRRNAVNKARGLINGRVALLTRNKPPSRVEPASLSQQAIDGARLAERFVEGMWGTNGWDIGRVLRDVGRNGEVDGVGVVYVGWDRNAGPKQLTMMNGTTSNEVQSPGEMSAVEGVDPDGQLGALQVAYGQDRAGDVCIRVIRPGAMFVDPFMTNDWKRAKWAGESMMVSRAEIEAQTGKSIRDLMNLSRTRTKAVRAATITESNAALDINDERAFEAASTADALVKHCCYILPHGDWPKGAYIEWLDVAPGAPLLMGAYEEDELPYFLFTPQPDGDHLLRSQGTMDDLAPIAREYNSMTTLLADWMRLVAKPTVAIPEGSLVSESVYNPEGYFRYRAGLGEPRFMTVPAEPGAIVQGYLGMLKQDMSEAAVQPDASRGFSQEGVNAGVSFAQVAQQVENQLSPTESELSRVLEMMISRALKLVVKHYTKPRLVTLPGAQDSEEIRAFIGSNISGATSFRVTGSMLPRSRAAVIQTLLQVIPLLGPEVKPYMGQIIDGDPTEWLRDMDAHKARQRREIRKIVALGGEENAAKVFENFQGMMRKVAEIGQAAQEDPAREPGVNPIDHAFSMMGTVRPPRLVDDLRTAGIDVPAVEDFDNHAQHLLALDQWSVTEEYEGMPPIVKQVAREHRQEHLERMGAQLGAMAEQTPDQQSQGSEPRELGEPSQPGMKGTQSPAGVAAAPAGGQQ